MVKLHPIGIAPIQDKDKSVGYLNDKLQFLLATITKELPPGSNLNCPRSCGQHKKEPLVGNIEF